MQNLNLKKVRKTENKIFSIKKEAVSKEEMASFLFYTLV